MRKKEEQIVKAEETRAEKIKGKEMNTMAEKGNEVWRAKTVEKVTRKGK